MRQQTAEQHWPSLLGGSHADSMLACNPDDITPEGQRDQVLLWQTDRQSAHATCSCIHFSADTADYSEELLRAWSCQCTAAGTCIKCVYICKNTALIIAGELPSQVSESSLAELLMACHRRA